MFNISEYITVKDAAERLGYTTANITRLIRKGDLPAAKRGRKYFIKEDDILDTVLDDEAKEFFA